MLTKIHVGEATIGANVFALRETCRTYRRHLHKLFHARP